MHTDLDIPYDPSNVRHWANSPFDGYVESAMHGMNQEPDYSELPSLEGGKLHVGQIGVCDLDAGP